MTRLRKGIDWHGWAFRFDDMPDSPCFGYFAQPHQPKNDKPSHGGQWVRVKFVPVDAEAKKAMRRKKVTR